MKTVSCIPGISQQKTFNYSWLSCPFILWLNIFTVKNPQKVTMSIEKNPFNFFNYFMKTHFLKSFLKEKSLNVFLIFHFWSMIFFFYQCLTTYIWGHYHAVLSITWELPFSFMVFFPSVFKSKFMFSFVHSQLWNM